MNRMWLVAVAPLLLMAAMVFGFYVLPSWANTVSPLTCIAILAGALVTGLCVLLVVFVGWWRGAYQLTRGDILVATTFASLDVLVPTTLAVLVWLLLQSLKNSRGFMF
ncbi:MAG TPA: hypothetical protein VGO96_17285 [Pyrinomonadaceae bacterium]|jgi:hypothetical protein|nr:hypothetical protein [Pyrinomonadaceae bacterium]